MACNVTTNSELDSNESNQNNSVKTVGANKSSNTVCDVEENITKITDLDGTQSPASSTYADCEETESPSIENLKEMTMNKVHVEVVTENKDEKCEKDCSSELSDNKTEINIHENKNEEKNNTNNITDNNIYTNTDLKELCLENNSDKLETVEAIQDVNSESEIYNYIENDINETDQEITDRNCDSVEGQNSLENNVRENDEYSDFGNNEPKLENDRENDEYSDFGNNEPKLENDQENDEYSDFGNNEPKLENDRENGDGQEINEEDASAQKKLDDDEDRRNPQYIPKKGFFYEHDDRTAFTSSEDEAGDSSIKKESEQKELEIKGKGRRSIPDGKWQHDLYKDEEQKPKSTQELIDIYGYDIRNEESAPKARRRRKYGRGPNKYTRKWDDEEAYAKQMLNKHGRTSQKLPTKQDEYETQFPVLKEQINSRRNVKSQESTDINCKRIQNHSLSRSDSDSKYKDDYRNHASAKSNSLYPRRTKSVPKQIPNSTDQSTLNFDGAGSAEIKQIQKSGRSPLIINVNKNRSRGRGIGHGKNSRFDNNYDSDRPQRMQFISANRGRAKRLIKPSQQHFPVKAINENDVRELSNQISSIDLKSVKRTVIDKNLYAADIDNGKSNDILQNQITSHGSSAVRSKRYSHQRQRLLPDSNIQNISSNMNIVSSPNIQSLQHSVQSIQSETDLCQSEAQTCTSMSYVTQTQLTSPPQNSEQLSVNATSIPSSSLAVSASLIPLSAPPLTASATALSAAPPPLPIVGFFQHPQDSVLGYTNQGTPTQLYTREQSVIGGPSNPPVQLVAFLPASPMLSNTNHSPSAPPPPPPPPPSSFPTNVMNYPQVSQTQQTPQPSFNSESYTIPPVTLATMHQTPEMYQSRGGVTYYNTRSQFKPRSPPPPRVKLAIPIVPPPSSETMK